MGASLLRYDSLPFCRNTSHPHLHVHTEARDMPDMARELPCTFSRFSNCQTSHGHQVQASRSDDLLAAGVEYSNHMDHSGGQQALLQLQIVELSCSLTCVSSWAPAAAWNCSSRLSCLIRGYGASEPLGLVHGGIQPHILRACPHMDLSSAARELGWILARLSYALCLHVMW